MAESSRWYSPKTGKPVECDKRVARKEGYLPGFTTVKNLLASPGLEIWKKRQVALASVTLPVIEGESADDRVARILKDSEEQGKQAREKGTDFHGEYARYFNEGIEPESEQATRTIREWNEWAMSQGKDVKWQSELSFVNVKYHFGGTIDLLGLSGNFIQTFCDFKTTDIAKFKNPYPEWALQLGAYSLDAPPFGFGLEAHLTECWSFIVDRATGELRTHLWPKEEIVRQQEKFKHLLAIWYLDNEWAK